MGMFRRFLGGLLALLILLFSPGAGVYPACAQPLSASGAGRRTAPTVPALSEQSVPLLGPADLTLPSGLGLPAADIAPPVAPSPSPASAAQGPSMVAVPEALRAPAPKELSPAREGKAALEKLGDSLSLDSPSLGASSPRISWGAWFDGGRRRAEEGVGVLGGAGIGLSGASLLAAAPVALGAIAGSQLPGVFVKTGSKGTLWGVRAVGAGAGAALVGALAFWGAVPALLGTLALGSAALILRWFRPPLAGIAARRSRVELFPIYSRGRELRMALEAGRLERPFLLSGTMEKGLGEKFLYGSFPSGERLVFFRRAGDTVQLVAKNMDFRAAPGSPMERALERSMGDSVLASAKIAEEAPGVVSFRLKDIFLTDLFGLRSQVNEAYKAKEDYVLNEKASTLAKPQAFPKNVELKAELVFSTPEGAHSKYLPDTRNLAFGMRYSLSALPEDAYEPRPADERVGYFATVHQDWSDPTKEDPHVRRIHRWKLEPGKPIVWWIENTVPHEFRDAVRRGILAWNKAFERIGIKDAIVVRQQPDPGEAPEPGFDPADARFNVFRWFLGADNVFAMGPLRADPRTGRIYNAGVMFSGAMLKDFDSWGDFMRETLEPVVDTPSARHRHSREGEDRCGAGGCRFAAQSAREFAFALSLRAAAGELSASERERMLGDYLTETVIHEIGHTLGLRHNFRASGYLSAEQLEQVQDGVIGASVMDYLPPNISLPGKPQGSYFQTDLGPYDYWAIEYGYGPAANLEAVAARGGEPGLAYATDEDAWLEMDPDTQLWSLGNNPLEFALKSVSTIALYWLKLQKRELAPGESYEQLLRGYWFGWRKYFRAVRLAVNYIGGLRHRRVRAGSATLPLEPVREAEQVEALDFLNRAVFSEELFQLSPEFAARLGAERKPTLEDPYPVLLQPPFQRIVSFLRQYTLALLFDPLRLDRLVESENLIKGEGGENRGLFAIEFFIHTASRIWKDLYAIRDGVDEAISKRRQKKGPLPAYRGKEPPFKLALTNLQRDLHMSHIDALGEVISDPSGYVPEDARSAAADSLNDIAALADFLLGAQQNRWVDMDVQNQAHLQEVLERVQSAKSEFRRLIRSLRSSSEEKPPGRLPPD